MELSEGAQVADGALPIEALKDHLRLASGFGLTPDQDVLLASYLRAALAHIEGRIGKALFSRRFTMILPEWRDGESQALPKAPVQEIEEIRLVDAAGASVVVAQTAYRLERDRHRPLLKGRAFLPQIPMGGQVEIDFEAGFGPLWSDIPADLRQAVLILAGEYYEHRHEDRVSRAVLPQSVQGLIEAWRNIRLLGGGVR